MRVKAAQTDEAEVDTSHWALPNETIEEAKAHQVLRQFAVRWWAKHQEKLTYDWLKQRGGLGPRRIEMQWKIA